MGVACQRAEQLLGQPVGQEFAVRVFLEVDKRQDRNRGGRCGWGPAEAGSRCAFGENVHTGQ